MQIKIFPQIVECFKVFLGNLDNILCNRLSQCENQLLFFILKSFYQSGWRNTPKTEKIVISQKSGLKCKYLTQLQCMYVDKLVTLHSEEFGLSLFASLLRVQTSFADLDI